MFGTSSLTLKNGIGYCAALAICVYFAFSFLIVVCNNFWPGPLFDYWVDIPLIEKSFNQQLTFSDLITAHNNAHRILIPRLLFILDYRFFAGTNVLLIAISLLCKIFTILLFNILLKDKTLSEKLLLNVLVFAGILNAGNVYNVLFNFDIQWDLVSVFSCYALFFYSQLFGTQTFHATQQLHYRFLAYGFLCLAFLSHAGALSLPPVFLFISLLHKKHKESAFNLLLIVTTFYINNHLPFADPENPDVQSAFAMLIIHADAVAIFVTKFITGSLLFHLGTIGWYFSIYLFILMITSIFLARKTGKASSNLFLYFALFLFLMIVSIAAARAMFTPHVWAASRFQTTALLFILTLHIHVWLVVSDLLKDKLRTTAQAVVSVHGFVMFCLIHYFTYNIPYKLSNVVFFSQAYMLAHERNQNNAPRLLLWIHDQDVIADSDTFFRKHGFAWYANKMLLTDKQSNHADFVDAGKNLVTANQLDELQKSCTATLPALKYHWSKDGGIEFSTPLAKIATTLLPKKTYYAVDSTGNVAGAAYIVVNESGFLKQASLEGYAINYDLAMFVEAGEGGRPVCAYALSRGL